MQETKWWQGRLKGPTSDLDFRTNLAQDKGMYERVKEIEGNGEDSEPRQNLGFRADCPRR